MGGEVGSSRPVCGDTGVGAGVGGAEGEEENIAAEHIVLNLERRFGWKVLECFNFKFVCSYDFVNYVYWFLGSTVLLVKRLFCTLRR